MGQKVNPIVQRLGIIRRWESNWYAEKHFQDKIVEDHRIREYIHARMPQAAIARIQIERMLKRVTLTMHTARAGVVIGKGGVEVERLREELRKLTKKDVQINIFEVKRPELEAALVADSVAQQLRSRISFRRAMRQAVASAMRVGAQGIKIKASGRLGGAEIARSEGYKEGRIPLHTFRGDVDYALRESRTIYGKIGVKVWIFKGEIYEKYGELIKKKPRGGSMDGRNKRRHASDESRKGSGAPAESKNDKG